ncbi:MAG: prephenate dehydrogenase [Chloroflexi bacterium]|nr:prephenate dehydrogenase [Chloroflexota bacterium]
MDEPGFTLAGARIAIVGLGLMGGSLALALKGHCDEIIGVDADASALAFALNRGIVHRAADLEGALATAHLIVLATPVRAILSQIQSLQQSAISNQQSKIIIDLGSTKQQITFAMSKLPAHFDPIGGHPMCGKETGGIAHAEAGLYRGKTFVLTPLARTSPAALALARELAAAVGAEPLLLPADRHDALAAIVSHLPYAAAVALMRAAIGAGDERLWQLAASGFRDTTRLAAGDLSMMTDILLTNRAAILHALTAYRAELDALAAAIDSGDPAALRAALEPAQRKRRELFK